MTTAQLDVDEVLERLDQVASQRPVAAQVVATTNNDKAGAGELAAILGADVALATKVMRLANSAYFGLSGKVTSLQFAVTVVGFNTVRSVATVALAGVDGARELPARYWDTSLHLAAASGTVAQQFQQVPTDAMCLGLLAQLGAALLHQSDPSGYDEVVATTGLGSERLIAETCRYGISGPQLTAEALELWRFPSGMVDALREVPHGPAGALLRTAYELTGRIVEPRHKMTPLDRLSGRRVSESQTRARMAAITADVQALRSALGL